MNTTLPRLPSRRDLINWVRRLPEASRPEAFDPRDARDEYPHPVCLYLKLTYGLDKVWFDTNEVILAKGYGITLAFDVNRDEEGKPGSEVAKYLKSLDIVVNELDEADRIDYPVLSPNELIQALEQWENPHACAYDILRQRALAR